MTDGQAHHQADQDLEPLVLGAIDDEHVFEDLLAEEAAQSTLDGMVRLIQASPQTAPVVLDFLDKVRDWPKADEIAARIRAMLEPEAPEEEPSVEQHKARPTAEAPAPVDPIHRVAIAADTAATHAARAAGLQVAAEAYERHRILAVAAVETMIAHAHVALAALKWEAENVPAVAGYLIQADRQLRIASEAVEARLQLADMQERVDAARGETAPAAA